MSGDRTLQTGKSPNTVTVPPKAAESPSLQTDAVPGIVDDVLHSTGAPLDSTTRNFMEPCLSFDFSRVRIHTDATSNNSAKALGAQAYTHGSHIVFGAGNYSPHTDGGKSLLAHELVHVKQQRGRDSRLSAADMQISRQHDPAERAVESAIHAAQRGMPITAFGYASTNTIYRAVETNGGSWDTSRYTAVNTGAGVGKTVGADISLEFTPNSLVVADNIGLTQTNKRLRSTAAGGPVNDPSFTGARNQALSLTGGDIGRGIDQGDSGDTDTIPNTNPLYAVENTPGNVSVTLTDVAPPVGGGFGNHGHRTQRADKTFDVGKASLSDQPRTQLAFVGQEWIDAFETTALVLDGPMRDTYLGSIAWGWRADATGNAILDPNPIKMINAGSPSDEFMDAAVVWNAEKFTDPTTGIVHDTVDLPTTSRNVLGSGDELPRTRSTKYLLSRIAYVDFEIANIATGAEVTNKTFERRALVTELLTRKANVGVTVVKTEDWLGKDEVYVEASSKGGSFKTAVVGLNDSEHHLFQIPLADVWNEATVGEPIHVKVLDEDVGSAIDRDDLIVDMLWPSPFVDFPNTRSYDGADYKAVLKM